VKTVGYSEKHYRASSSRGRADDIRTAEVPADLETKARKLDFEYKCWSYQRGGPPDPVFTLVPSLLPVIDLGVGASSGVTLGSSSRQLQRRVRWCLSASMVPPRLGSGAA